MLQKGVFHRLDEIWVSCPDADEIEEIIVVVALAHVVPTE
ncbi:hypothetical protein X756_26305 [Mesorhizobium sp. LSHC412B00]|nr:hypothetical protein X756_26305 [Mesorhizobium sp. LSHC412B00]